ncbi:hypothetical protein IJ21_24280 [Paenibacillus sp. 32O-W]|uniref:Uncharacterized protein n=1 Tax=Paenibacillus cisolokensis TaxID=1658519 RepID=A0ABQ4NC22_9BACL|nr:MULTISPECIES: hypothetical protein [Paenibacillus]ALS27824.1 hypothetical protein IJ21_24280 [Paenibacillus sp. 32O-W]GIQ65725.1 hypothetical protein PACILC2_42930 [Paenibacillus cisolokensis]
MIARIVRMTPVLLAAAMLTLSAAVPAAFASTEPLKPIQMFDTAAGRVVRSFDNDAQIQEMAHGWLRSAYALSPRIKADKECPFVFRVPLDKPAAVHVKGTSLTTHDVFLFYCRDAEHTLLVFDEQRRPYVLLFKADITPFLQKTGLAGQPGFARKPDGRS